MAKRAYEVRLTAGAERDLEAIYDYLAANRSPDDAETLLDALLETIGELERFPFRGPVPKELAPLGIEDFRQALRLPYRIIYRVTGETVFVTLIADGRRDMAALLARRLLAD